MIGQPIITPSFLPGPEVAAAADPQQLGEPDAPIDHTANRPDRHTLRHIGLDLIGDWLFVYVSCVGYRTGRILSSALS